jgi:hypothetical protein
MVRSDETSGDLTRAFDDVSKTNQTATVGERRFLSTVAGIFAIFGSLIDGGILLFIILGYSPFPGIAPYGLLFDMILLGFLLGLNAGIQSIRRRNFRLTIIGIILLLISSVLATVEFVINPFPAFSNIVLQPGTMMLIFSMLSLILVIVSRGQFAPHPVNIAPPTIQVKAAVRRRGFATIAGILSVFCSLLQGGVVVLVLFSLSPYAEYTALEALLIRIVFITGVLGFFLGLTAGIQSIRRRSFWLTVLGICFLVAGSVATIAHYLNEGISPYFFFQPGWLMLIISVLSLIFVSISKAEFASHATEEEPKIPASDILPGS